MIALAAQSLWLVTLGLFAVLVLRRPLRALCGARVAYALWLLVPTLALLPLLPRLSVDAPVHIAAPVGAVARLHDAPAAESAMLSLAVVVWAGGCVLWSSVLVLRYLRLLRSCRPVSAAERRRWTAALRALRPRGPLPRLAWHAAGPALLWSLPPRLLLPRDFGARHDEAQRRLVLLHELSHYARGDAWWNLAAELLRAFCWFHPLLWVAMPRFRLDQELACDAAVLELAPDARGAYARALLQDTPAALVLTASHWLTESQLKERIAMLGRSAHSPWVRRAGFVSVLVLVAGAAWAGQSSPPVAATVQPPAMAGLPTGAAPAYPKSSADAHHEGLVMLRVYVRADGTVGDVRLDGNTPVDPQLAQAAMDASRKWKFDPARHDGHAVAGWVRVPVSFRLDEDSAPAHDALPTAH